MTRWPPPCSTSWASSAPTTLCCPPPTPSVPTLEAERIPGARVVPTGNTGVEAVQDSLPGPRGRAAGAARHGVEPERFVLTTLHRPENVDDPSVLGTIL